MNELRIFREHGAKRYLDYPRSMLLHELLHNSFPERPETHQYRSQRPIFHNNIRKVGSFRNRQVSGSSPLVGSILSITYRTFSLHPQLVVTWFVT